MLKRGGDLYQTVFNKLFGAHLILSATPIDLEAVLPRPA